MAKWVSPILTDIRNQVGRSVVFSIWKGRGYFRQYVKPANPKTAKQRAHRDVMRQLVKRWQQIIDTPEKKAAWNTIGLLEGNITGYNVFTKYGRKSRISCPGSASVNDTITITYTLGLPAAVAMIVARKPDGSLEIVADAGTLEAGENKTVTYQVTSSGKYEFYIADSRVLVEGDTAPVEYQMITKWTPDEVNGVAKAAECEVS